jgi:TRAP-type C4-dicarboxylate transport system permease small subunit
VSAGLERCLRPVSDCGCLKLSRGMAALNRLVLGAAMIALVAAALVLTLGVFLRYFLRAPTDWQDETAVFLLVGVTFMCGAYVQQERGHVGVEAIAGLLPPRANRIRQWLCDTASCAFCVFFSWKSWTLFHEAWVEGQTTSSSWAPPLWLPYSLMAVGMTLLSLQLLLQISSGCASIRSGG